MSETINLLNASHIQANKLSAKCKAAYPIMLLPLRLEARFMHLEPSIGTTTVDPDAHVLTVMAPDNFGKADQQPMEAIEQGIDQLIDKSSHLSSNPDPSTIKTLTAWKYAAVRECITLHSKNWIPNYTAAISKMEELLQSIQQHRADWVIQSSGKAALLSTTQLEQWAIYTQQLLDTVTNGDAVATTKGSYFIQIMEYLLEQVEQFTFLFGSYSLVHPENYEAVYTILNPVLDALIHWENQAQSHLNSFYIKKDQLKTQLTQVQQQLDTAYTTIEREAEQGNQLVIWKNISGIHQRIPLYKEALKAADYEQVGELLETMEAYTQELLDPITNLEELSVYIHSHVLTLPISYEQLKEQTNQELETLVHALLHYQGITAGIQAELGRALEQLGVDEKSKIDSTPYLQKMESMVKLLAAIPVAVQDWSAIQVLLHSQLQQLTLDVLSIKALKGQEKQSLMEQWQQASELFLNWQTAVQTQVEELNTKRENITNRYTDLQQLLYGLPQDNWREQASEPVAAAWKAHHQWQLFLENFAQQPTQKIKEQPEQLHSLEQWVNNSQEAWSRVEQPSTSTLLKIAHNIGKSTAALQQVTTTRAVVQEELALLHQQLLSQKAQLFGLLEAIIINEEASTTPYDAIKASLLYLQEYSRAITVVTAPTNHIDLVLYDYWSLEALLEKAILLVGQVTQLPTDYKQQLESYLNGLLEGITYRMATVDQWLNDLQGQEKGLNQQRASITTALQHQENNYLQEGEDTALYTFYQQAALLQDLADLLQDSILAQFDNKALLEQLQEPTNIIASTATEGLRVTPAYKEYISQALTKVKEATSTVLQRQEGLQKNSTLAYQAVQKQYEQLQIFQEYGFPEGEGEELSPVVKDNLQTAVAGLLHHLQVEPALGSSVIEQQFLYLNHQLKDRAEAPINTEDQQWLNSLLYAVNEPYENWQSQNKGKIEALQTQTEALTLVGETIRIGGQGGQTNVAALPGGGQITVREINNGVICTLPPWGGVGGTGGPGGPGGPTDPDPTDPTELSNYELWIRAYPDDIAINNHEKRLTEEEIEAAIIYWTAVWNAMGKTKVEIGAWRVLVARYGAERAAWLVKKMTPTNVSTRPTAVAISTTVLEGIASMRQEDILQTGASFWRDMVITHNSAEQEGVISNFKTTHPRGKAEALAYLTQPEQLGQALYEQIYKPAVTGEVDQQAKKSLLASTAQIEARSQQLANELQVSALNSPVPVFPVLAAADRRDNTWSMAAYTEVMPDQLVFLLYNWEGEVVYEVVGNVIPEKLPIGIDPNDDTQFDTSQADLGIKPNTIKWMTNFEEAINKGMAVKIPISETEGKPETIDSTQQAGFSRIYVLGIKHYDREEETVITNDIEQRSQEQIEELLEAHHYTDGGLAILHPGTATNNTSEKTSEFSFFLDDVKDTFQTEIQYALSSNKSATRPADGHLLAEALGINSQVFKHIKNNRGHSNHNAELINKALWMSTWGLYLEEMFGHKEGFFSTLDFLPNYVNFKVSEYDNNGNFIGSTPIYKKMTTQNHLHYLKLPEDLDKIYQFFTQHVKGRGGLPSIRVGKQPYGILTTGLLQQNNKGWKWLDAPATGSNTELSKGFLDKFQKLLLKYLWGYKASGSIPPKWLRIVQEKIKTVDDPITASSSTGLGTLTGLQEQFMKILRLHPTAASYYARYALNPYSMISHSSSGLSNTTYESLFRGNNVSLLNDWVQFNFTFQNEFEEYIDHYENAGAGITIPTSSTILNSLRLFDTYDNGNLETLQPLKGAVVEEVEPTAVDKTITPITGQAINYIEWLRTTSPIEIINRNQQPASPFAQGGEPANTLLYQALKGALLDQYWDAAARIFEKEQFRDYSFKHFSYGGATGWAAFEHFLNAGNILDKAGYDSQTNSDYYYTLRRLYNSNTNSTTENDYRNYGYFKRDSYKVFVMGVKPHVVTKTHDQDYIQQYNFPLPSTGDFYSHSIPYFGTDVLLANGRLPFLTEVNVDDVPNIPASNMSMGAYLFPGTGILPVNALMDYPEETAGLRALLNALKVLAQQPIAELERLFAEHMDLASHRLDAWILGMANKRLHTIRENNKTGTYLGSYGWLMDLKPGGQRTAVNNASILYNVDKTGNVPVMLDPDNQGYIQAPSLNHAMTAAVLRSGYEAHKGTEDGDLLAINLSSERVRRALFYIEGIRNGQHLGALLGYRLERTLREYGLAQYTLDLRQAYPIQQLNYQDNNQQTLEPTSPSSVVDGLAIVEKIRAIEQTGEEFGDAFPYVSLGDQTGVAVAMDKIVQDMDALADLSLAEGTFQMVIGNYGRSNAMMSALTKGTPIPEPEIIKTPRTGQTLTHRVGLTLEAVDTATASPIWAGAFTARALAEPALNAKLGDLLPNPSQVQCQVEYQRKDGADNITTEVVNVSLSHLQIEPIDLLYIFPESIKDSYTELAKRFYQVAFQWVTGPNSLAPYDNYYDFKLDFEAPSAGDYTVADIAPLVAQLQLLFSNSRYLRAGDLVHPTTDTSNLELTGVGSNALQELAARASTLRNSLEQAATNLNANSGRAELWNLAAYGLSEAALATPQAEQVVMNLSYADASASIQTLALDKVAQYDKVVAPIFNDPDLDTGGKVELYQKAVSTLLGKSFLMLPQIVPLNATALQNAHGAASSILPTQDAMAVERWTAGAARVRRQINRLENVSFLQGLFLDYDTESLQLSPVQLPYRPNDHWVGVEVPNDYYKNHFLDTNLVSLDKLSLVMDWHTAPSATPFVGLLVDEWIEKIPGAEETAGLAFHYDQPNAKAPQSILLAVHPQDSAATTAWEWHQLVNTLDTTLELSKIRAVEPDHLQTATFSSTVYSTNDPTMNVFDAFSQLLPATYNKVAAPNSEESWSTDYHKNNNTHLYKTN